jgi:UDP-GlcNAc:undecaprenyl-phosphate GlcNAc-1-phosphate transferase
MAVIVAFAVAVVSVPIAARLAQRIGFVDRPGPLKVQRHPIPYGGGVPILVAVAVPVAVTRASFLVPLALACALGLIDDTRDLPVAFRLPTEVAIGLVTAWVAAPHTVPYVLLAVVLVILLLNAANLLDGLDGMLSSVAALGAIGFSVALGGSASALALAFVGALAAGARVPRRRGQLSRGYCARAHVRVCGSRWLAARLRGRALRRRSRG